MKKLAPFFLLLLLTFCQVTFAQQSDIKRLLDKTLRPDSVSKSATVLDDAKLAQNGLLRFGTDSILNHSSNSIENFKNKIDSVEVSGQRIRVDSIQVSLDRAIVKKTSAVTDKLRTIDETVNSQLSKVDNGIQRLSSIDANVTAPLPSLPNVSLNNDIDLSIQNSVPNASVPDIKELTSATQNAEEILKTSSDIPDYSSQLAKLDNANVEKLPSEVESKVSNLQPLEGLKTSVDEVAQNKLMVQKWQSDPEFRKEMILNKAKEQAINHFAGHEKELQAALSKFTDVKAKYKKLEGEIDLIKKKQANPMKDKPYSERIIPGVTFQFLEAQNFSLDINPQLSYRLTGRFTLGTGWVKRIMYEKESDKIVYKATNQGLRSFVHFSIRSGMWLKTDVEYLNVRVNSSQQYQKDQLDDSWKLNLLVGMKKDFRFSKHLFGNVQFLYNLNDNPLKSANSNKFNVRIGFEYRK